MSYPYRFFDLLIDSEETLIILMRLLNIAMVIAGIILFRQVFLKAKTSKRVINLSVIFFVITPIVPFLAAHVNYDNLMFMLAPIVLGSTYNMYKNQRVDLVNLVAFISIGAFTILIKNSFLPIFVGLGLVVGVVGYKSRTKLFTDITHEWKLLNKAKKVGLILLAIASITLTIERYGYNVIVYKSLWPKCDIVQNEQVCRNYMPWYRNNQNKLNSPNDDKYANPASYTQHWISKMTRGFFAIFSHTPTNVISWHEPFGPIVLRPIMPLPIVVASLAFPFGIVLVLINRRKILNNDLLKIVIFIIVWHIFILLALNYRSYLNLGYAQAIQARYTYPLILPGTIVCIAAGSFLKINKQNKILLASLVLLAYALGGGVSGWIIRSDNLWYWQQRHVILINNKAQNLLEKTTIH